MLGFSSTCLGVPSVSDDPTLGWSGGHHPPQVPFLFPRVPLSLTSLNPHVAMRKRATTAFWLIIPAKICGKPQHGQG